MPWRTRDTIFTSGYAAVLRLVKKRGKFTGFTSIESETPLLGPERSQPRNRGESEQRKWSQAGEPTGGR